MVHAQQTEIYAMGLQCLKEALSVNVVNWWNGWTRPLFNFYRAAWNAVAV